MPKTGSVSSPPWARCAPKPAGTKCPAQSRSTVHRKRRTTAESLSCQKSWSQAGRRIEFLITVGSSQNQTVRDEGLEIRRVDGRQFRATTNGHRRNHAVGQRAGTASSLVRSEEHTSELQSLRHLVCRLLLEKKKKTDA